MVELRSLLSGPHIDAIGWTLIHFIWQGAVVAGSLMACNWVLVRHRPEFRYAAASGAMILLLLSPGITFSLIYPGPMDSNQYAGGERLVRHGSVTGVRQHREPIAETATVRGPANWRPVDRLVAWLDSMVPLFVGLWLTGAMLLSLHTTIAWTYLQYVRRRSSPHAQVWVARARKLAGELLVRRQVCLRQSNLVDVPTVVGWIRPYILLPADLPVDLPTQQIKALLIHELIHIRRHDYLVNLLQALTETLLFFHPAIWWVSHRMRVEREYCCDDAAAGAAGGATNYAQALLALERRRNHHPRFATAASDGFLLGRMRRILVISQSTQSQRRPNMLLLPSFFFILLASLFAGLGSVTPVSAQISPNSVVLPGGEQLELLLIPDGTNVPLGPSANDIWAQPIETDRLATLGAFYLAKYELTRGQWDSVVDAVGAGSGLTTSPWLGQAKVNPSSAGDIPATYISWHDVNTYVDLLNAHTTHTFRLPTHDEWEYAARDGESTVWPFGDVHAPQLDLYAVYGNANGFPLSVTTGLPSDRWGLQQMLGNVREWTADDFPVGSKIFKGGGFEVTWQYTRPSFVNATSPGARNFSVGVRLVMDLPENTAPDVGGAGPNPETIWPPNKKMVPVEILGVVDPDGDNVVVTIVAISDDESDDAGDHAGIGTETASVRAERDGKGDGRTYTITFEASDGINPPVEGSVIVVVPHDQGKKKNGKPTGISTWGEIKRSVQ